MFLDVSEVACTPKGKMSEAKPIKRNFGRRFFGAFIMVDSNVVLNQYYRVSL
jgi:hypothetical protein